MKKKIQEFATIHDVPIMRAGTHRDKERTTYQEEDLDEIVEQSNAAREYIKTSIELGQYPGNDFHLEKPIPGVINLSHQKFLRETLRDAVKDVSVEFSKKMIDGVNWICATYRNVRQDVAEFLAQKFPFRSVEIIPELFDPDKQTTYRKVIRSTGFLDPETPPAVIGQNPSLLLEFAQADPPVVTVFSWVADDVVLTPPGVEHPPKQGVINMEEKKQEIPVTPVVDVQEFEALKAKVQEFERLSMKVQEMEAKNQALSVDLAKERGLREGSEILIFCAELNQRHASPAYVGLIKPILEKADNAAILEFGETKQTLREALQGVFAKIIEMKDAIVVPMKEEGKAIPPARKGDLGRQRIQEFEAEAKGKAVNPNDPKEVFMLAYGLAIAKYGDNLY